MNEGKGAMTYDAFMDVRSISGVPGVAVRVGRALESWGRRAAEPMDRDAVRREYERQLENETRMLQMERLGLQHR